MVFGCHPEPGEGSQGFFAACHACGSQLRLRMTTPIVTLNQVKGLDSSPAAQNDKEASAQNYRLRTMNTDRF